MGAGHRENQATIRNLQSHPQSLVEGRRVGDRVYDPSCLCDQLFIKTPNLQGSGNFRDDEHIHIPARGCTPTSRDRTSCAQDPSKPHFVDRFIWLFTIVSVIFFIKKPVHVNVP